MTADRRYLKRGLYQAVCLLAAMAVALSARPVAAGTLAAAAPVSGAPLSATSTSTTAVPTRLEGVLKSTGTPWLVDDHPVTRTGATVVREKRGPARPGAWVLVTGTQNGGTIVAQVIEVLRSSPPLYEFTGILTKQGGLYWLIGDSAVLKTDSTEVGPGVALGTMVRATARPKGSSAFEATRIELVAPSADAVPLAIKGTVQQVSDTSWVVDDTTIVVPPDKQVDVDQGDTVEISALDNGGTLVAQAVRRVDTSREAGMVGYVTGVEGRGEDDQTWTMLVFEGNQTSTQTVSITADTYIDEDRTVGEPGVEARIDGAVSGAGRTDANLIRLNKPLPGSASGALVPAGDAAVWLVGTQRVWFDSDALKEQALAAARLQPDGSPPAVTGAAGANVFVRGVRLSNGVLIAQEVLSEDPGIAAITGINTVDWSGPNYVNANAPLAAKPTVLFDARGGGHAVYESMGTIYYCYQEPGGKWGVPRRIGNGVAPAAVLDAQGLVHVAFRSEFAGNFEIMHARKLPNGNWHLPIVVGPTSGPSADPALAADASGNVYLTWSDDTSGAWTIQLGTWDGKTWTTFPVKYGRGQSPALTVMPDGAIFLAWQDLLPQREDPYGKYEIFTSERKMGLWSLPADVSDNLGYRPGVNSLGVRLTAAEGLAHLAWIDDTVQVRYVYGRGEYWPAPTDLGPKHTKVRNLDLRAGADGMLYVALDDNGTVSVLVSPPRSVQWPDAQLLAASGGAAAPVSYVTLSSSPERVAVTWVQPDGAGNTGVYESRHDVSRLMLKFYMPMIANQ